MIKKLKAEEKRVLDELLEMAEALDGCGLITNMTLPK
jgi:hypothetical protein